MGGGKRKPELESQTKRVTQKQKPRNTKKQKTKNLPNDTGPRVPAAGPSSPCCEPEHFTVRLWASEQQQEHHWGW